MKGFLLGCAIAAAPIMQTVSAAADLGTPTATSVPYVPIMFNWTGFHIGATLGRGWARANMIDIPRRVSFGVRNHSVFVGGSQIGYNDQISPTVVLGAERLMDGIKGDRNSNNAFIPAFGDRFDAFAREDFVTTLTGRVGFAAPGWDRWLVYIKGGGWAETQAVVTDLGTGTAFSTTHINGGSAAGVGLEWAFAPNGTARIEHQCLGLSGFPLPDEQPSRPTATPSVAHGFASDRNDVNTLSVGISYLSNWSPSPIMARY